MFSVVSPLLKKYLLEEKIKICYGFRMGSNFSHIWNILQLMYEKVQLKYECLQLKYESFCS